MLPSRCSSEHDQSHPQLVKWRKNAS